MVEVSIYFPLFRYVTVDRIRGGVTPATTEFTSNQVGVHAVDLDTLVAQHHTRLRREVNIVYPSDSPQPLLPSSPSSSLAQSPLKQVNQVSYIYPQSYSPPDPSPSSLPSSPASPSTVFPSSSSLPSSPPSPSSSLPYSPEATLSSSLMTSSSYLSSSSLPPSTTTTTTRARTTEAEFDYSDWEMVVNVVKSVSVSDDSVLIVTNEPTGQTTVDNDFDTTPVMTTTVSTPTTTTTRTTTTILKTTTTTTATTPAVTTAKEEKLAGNRTRFGSRRPSVGPSIKIHPFLSKFNKEKTSSTTTASPTTEALKTTKDAAHPFLNQIKSTEKTKGNATVKTTAPTTTTAAKTTATTPLTTTRTSLFGRFSFLNRNRPQKEENKPAETKPSPTKDTKRKKPSFFNSFKNRPVYGKSKLPKSSSQKSNEEEEIVLKENITDVKNENQTPSEESSQESLSSELSKPSFKRTGGLLSSLTRSKLPSSSTVEKPRPKRLPPPFSSSRNSLFGPRRPLSFSALSKKITTTEASSTDRAESTPASSSSNTTEKQTSDIFAQLNGKDKSKDEAVTLRPRAFKPKFGSGNAIRAKLKAELAKGENGSESYESKIENGDNNRKEETTPSSTAVAKTLPRVLPTRVRGLPRTRPSLPRPAPSRTRLPSKPRSFSSFRNRPSTQQQTTTDKPNPVVKDTSNIVFRPTVVSPDNNAGVTQNRNVEVSVDSMHANDAKKDKMLTTKSPFQVLEDSVDDQTHMLVTDHHPEIHFRHLKPDLLPTEPRETTVFDMLEETIDDREVTHEMIIPTTLTPRLLNKIPSTAEAFLPTITEEMFLPTINQAAAPAPTPARASTKPQGRRLRGRGRARTAVKRPVATARPSVGEIRKPQESLRNRPTRLRTRSRVRSQTEKPEELDTEFTAATEVKEAPRSSFGRRPISRSRSNFIRTPETKPRKVVRPNTRLRIRGGGRKRTTTTQATTAAETEASSAVTDAPSTTLQEETSSQKVKGNVVDSTSVFTVEPTDSVDTMLNVVRDQDLDSEKSTLRPGTFVPKQGSDAVRAKLRQELNKEREFTFGSQQVPENFELDTIPVAGPDQEVAEDVQDLEVPAPGPAREVTEDIAIRPPPLPNQIINEDLHLVIRPPPPPPAPTPTVQQQSSKPTIVKDITVTNPLNAKKPKRNMEDSIIEELTEEQKTDEQGESVVELNNRQSRRFRPRGALTRTRPNVKSNQLRLPQRVKSQETVAPDFYDPRLKRQGAKFDAPELSRAGRSTVAPPAYTEKTLSLNRIEESSLKSVLSNEIQDQPIKPFLLRGGKGERKLFSTRYKAEIKINSLPEKKNSEKISGPNPSLNTFPVPKNLQKTVFNKNNIMKNKTKKNSNKRNEEKKKNLLNLLKKESAQKKQTKKNSPKSFDFRKPRLEFGRKTSGLSQVWTH